MSVEPGDEVRIEKIVTIFNSRDNGIYSPREAAARQAVTADGFDELLAPHLTRVETRLEARPDPAHR